MRNRLLKILREPIFPHELVDPHEAVADYLLDSDVVPVVRCKDCVCGKHPGSTMLVGKLVRCALYDPMPMMRCNDFCSYGERKDNG